MKNKSLQAPGPPERFETRGAHRRRAGRAGGWRETRPPPPPWNSRSPPCPHKGRQPDRLCPRPSADLAQQSWPALPPAASVAGRPDLLHPARPEEGRRRRLGPSERSPGPLNFGPLRRRPTAWPTRGTRGRLSQPDPPAASWSGVSLEPSSATPGLPSVPSVEDLGEGLRSRAGTAGAGRRQPGMQPGSGLKAGRVSRATNWTSLMWLFGSAHRALPLVGFA